MVLVATAGAVLAVFVSALGGLAGAALALFAVVVGARAAGSLFYPDLELRIEEEGLQWRRRSAAWSTRVHSSFVSPWFIGWRTGRFRACGVFRAQLGDHEFRRLAVVLRHAGASPPG